MELAVWHRGAKLILIERQLNHLFHLRAATLDNHEPYAEEVERLENEKDKIINPKKHKRPTTPEEMKQARLEFAQTLGLKVVAPKENK